ncbi:hypothetical protein D3C73_1158960 [compost metagenome]
MNARRSERDFTAGCTNGFNRCRELLDELEVGVNMLYAGFERSLHLREAAAQRGELRLTAAHRAALGHVSAVKIYRPFHIYGRLRPFAG